MDKVLVTAELTHWKISALLEMIKDEGANLRDRLWDMSHLRPS
jgi:hypothetical protein